jgi:NitT/TauT family transport system substrate-binding protein
MRTNRRDFLKHGGGAACAGLAVQLLAACAPSPTPSLLTAPAATAAPAVAKSLRNVTCGFASLNPSNLVSIVGSEKPDLPGAFGIAFDLVTTTNSPNALSALVGGSLDVAVVTPDAAWMAQDKAPDIKQLFAVGDGTAFALIAQPGIQKASDLKGMTLGASALRGGADTTALRLLLFENGLRNGDYTIVQAGTVSDRTAAMKARAIQAVVQQEPQATLLRDAGFAQIDNANNYPSLKNVHFVVLVAKRSWYEGKPDVAANFVRAWEATTRWIYDPANKDEVIAVIKKTMDVSDIPAQNTYKVHIGQAVVSQDLHIKEAFMQQFIDNQKKVGGENQPSKPMKYVDASLLERALGA